MQSSIVLFRPQRVVRYLLRNKDSNSGVGTSCPHVSRGFENGARRCRTVCLQAGRSPEGRGRACILGHLPAPPAPVFAGRSFFATGTPDPGRRPHLRVGGSRVDSRKSAHGPHAPGGTGHERPRPRVNHTSSPSLRGGCSSDADGSRSWDRPPGSRRPTRAWPEAECPGLRLQGGLRCPSPVQHAGRDQRPARRRLRSSTDERERGRARVPPPAASVQPPAGRRPRTSARGRGTVHPRKASMDRRSGISTQRPGRYTRRQSPRFRRGVSRGGFREETGWRTSRCPRRRSLALPAGPAFSGRTIRRRVRSPAVPDAGRRSGSVSGDRTRPSRARPAVESSAWWSDGRSPSWSSSGSAAWLGTGGRVRGAVRTPARRGGEARRPARRPRGASPIARRGPRDRLPDRPGSGVVPPRVDAGRLQEPRRRRARPRLQRLVLRRLPQPGRRRRRRSQRQERRHPLDLDLRPRRATVAACRRGSCRGCRGRRFGADPPRLPHRDERRPAPLRDLPGVRRLAARPAGLSVGATPGRARRGNSRTVPPRSWRSWTSSGRGCRRDSPPSEAAREGWVVMTLGARSPWRAASGTRPRCSARA